MRKKITFAEWVEKPDKYDAEADYKLVPVNKRIEYWLAEYFKVDMNKVEKECRQMLEEMRK